ncbi:hypothetical protein [Stenotrophomonas sp. NPDC077659]|uniref:hypothetical protein n=1 Tax=Stenotrophomonas sp. NPDC077659 TaxID=3390694 RepID=UPI003D07732B
MSRVALAGIELPADLQWTDEFTAWRIGQQVRTSLSGALIVQESARQAGRPITLQTTRDGQAYVAPIQLDVLRQLQSLSEQLQAAPMTLVLPAHNGGDRTFQVRWLRTEGAALDAQPLRFATPAVDADFFSITLRLMTV